MNWEPTWDLEDLIVHLGEAGVDVGELGSYKSKFTVTNTNRLTPSANF